ncbi:MAG: hypothetical protein ACI9LM_000978 [Alteromonadaceae bacterium]|jgi:hypothetical protein
MNTRYQLIVLILIICLIPASFAKESITFKVSIKQKKAQLLLPVPNHLISVNAQLQLFEMDTSIDVKYKIYNDWPVLEGKKYIRLLLLEVDLLPGSNLLLEFKWDNDKSNNKMSNIVLQKNVQLVYPSSNWLAQSLLLHPTSETSHSGWYTEPQSYYAEYVTNKELLLKKGYPQTIASQWLYDRPQAIYQLFLQSGNSKWLNKGHDLSRFYINSITGNGSFKLSKKNDVKYLMPKGLLYKYLLSADNEAKNALEKIYQLSLLWDPEYSLERGFWTERNQAAALNTAISYWEATGDETAVERINQIIDATVKMTFRPVNDWNLVGCPQHTFKSHEGEGGYSPSCSPWMMALLSDALWRYYLLTGDVRAASLIDAFGDFILNHGIYWGDEKVSNVVIPKYLAILGNLRYEQHNQWTDHQHTCDVAGLLGKSVYIKKTNKVDDSLLKELFSVFIQQCKNGFELTKSKQKKATYWILKPPRRFNWMFSTTSDLPWLVEYLLVENN